jgi:transposase-like protein
MHKEAIEELDVRFKLLVLDLAEDSSVTRICREYNVPRSSFYRWKKRYDQEGPSGLYRKKPIAYNHPRKTPPEVIAK